MLADLGFRKDTNLDSKIINSITLITKNYINKNNIYIKYDTEQLPFNYTIYNIDIISCY